MFWGRRVMKTEVVLSGDVWVLLEFECIALRKEQPVTSNEKEQ